jgi:hypothetical protein
LTWQRKGRRRLISQALADGFLKLGVAAFQGFEGAILLRFLGHFVP